MEGNAFVGSAGGYACHSGVPTCVGSKAVKSDNGRHDWFDEAYCTTRARHTKTPAKNAAPTRKKSDRALVGRDEVEHNESRVNTGRVKWCGESCTTALSSVTLGLTMVLIQPSPRCTFKYVI